MGDCESEKQYDDEVNSPEIDNYVQRRGTVRPPSCMLAAARSQEGLESFMSLAAAAAAAAAATVAAAA